MFMFSEFCTHFNPYITERGLNIYVSCTSRESIGKTRECLIWGGIVQIGMAGTKFPSCGGFFASWGYIMCVCDVPGEGSPVPVDSKPVKSPSTTSWARRGVWTSPPCTRAWATSTPRQPFPAALKATFRLDRSGSRPKPPVWVIRPRRYL